MKKKPQTQTPLPPVGQFPAIWRTHSLHKNGVELQQCNINFKYIFKGKIQDMNFPLTFQA